MPRRRVLMKKPHRLRAVTYLATFAMLFSLCAGIMITDSASAKSGRRRPHKVSTDLGDNSGGGDLVTAVLQLSDNPSAQKNRLLKRTGVRIRTHFQSLNTYAVEHPESVVDELSSFDE